MTCGGCNVKVHYAKMMKTHQLSGNARKESRCPDCHPGYQQELLTTQMSEQVYNTASSLGRLQNWGENQEVKEAMLHLTDKIMDQLGAKRKFVPVTVNVNGPAPCTATVGETDVTVGVGAVTTTADVFDADAPPPAAGCK